MSPDAVSRQARGFEAFAEEAAPASPLYAALGRIVAADPGLLQAFAAADGRYPTIVFAAVQRVLADVPGADLAAYYPSFGGTRSPDPELARVFAAFVAEHGTRIRELIVERDTQTNEPLRAAQLRPALGWAQACFGRGLGLVEVGTSAGLLLRPERYHYEYLFGDGDLLDVPAPADPYDDSPALTLRCEVRGTASAKTLSPFVAKGLRISSRVGLDLAPLDPADSETRAWLRALVWPEESERRERLDAALAVAVRHPVKLRQGDAVRILADAVHAVATPNVPCVVVSNVLAHMAQDARNAFVDLLRDLGARRDLVLVLKEAAQVGLGLFSGDGLRSAPGEESLGAVVFQAGRERCVRLGTAGLHGSWLDWAPGMA